MAKFLTLSSGHKIPSLGLGTWQINKDNAKVAITTALDAGYRMIDTAYYYNNEQCIGEVLEEYLKEGKSKREDIFVTDKLPSIHGRPSDVKASLENSLRKLRLDYVDLYLIHMPFTCQNLDQGVMFPEIDGKVAVDESVDISDIWKAMEEIVDQGKAKSIGVSNFNSQQVEAICKVARIKPVVNQVECHPYLPQYELQAFCEERGILLTAYSPLGSPGRGVGLGIDISREPVLMEEEIIASLSKKYSKTPAQIILRFLVQRGLSVIPKSSNPGRIESNIEVYDFQLTKEDMADMAKLQNGKRYFGFTKFVGAREYPFGIPF